MNHREIKVMFYYNGNYQCEFNCKPNQNVRQICSKYAKKYGMSFYSLFFVACGKKLDSLDFDKSLNQLLKTYNNNLLPILVYKGNDDSVSSENTENRNILTLNNVYVFFIFRSQTTKIKCKRGSQIVNICKSFANKVNKSLNSLEFFYRNQNLDFSKTFAEIANTNDINNRQIEITVKEIDLSTIDRDSIKIINQSFCQTNKKKKIIFVIIAVIILLIGLGLTLYFTLRKKK